MGIRQISEASTPPARLIGCIQEAILEYTKRPDTHSLIVDVRTLGGGSTYRVSVKRGFNDPVNKLIHDLDSSIIEILDSL